MALGWGRRSGVFGGGGGGGVSALLGIYILDHAVAPKFMRSSVTASGYFRFLPQYFPCAQPTPPGGGGGIYSVSPPLHHPTPWMGGWEKGRGCRSRPQQGRGSPGGSAHL